MTWQITDMPIQHGSGTDYVGWLADEKRGVHVKIQISPIRVTQEAAFLIMQQFAGILTPFGLEEMWPK